MGAFIHVTAWERKSLWRRTLLAFARVAALLLLLTGLFNLLGPQIEILLMTRWEAKKDSSRENSPTAADRLHCVPRAGQNVVLFGLFLRSPMDIQLQD